ncbi:MAG TPA: Fur family transcriptional regulator [Ignavibacteriales bacterium]|nr:Fur family transcriptional regulator [Ignavibacteriales bacterium]
MKNTVAENIFREFLKNGKYRITPERFEILESALEYDGHFGADELYIAMKNRNSRVSRATVYKTLELLEKCELLSKRNFGDNMNRYESAFGKRNHDHFVCINCGKIIEFTTPKIYNILNEIGRDLDFDVTGYSFYVFGKCKDSKKCKRS